MMPLLSGSPESIICPILTSHEIGLTERIVWLYAYGMKLNGAPLPTIFDIAKALRWDEREVFRAFTVLQKEEWLKLIGSTYQLANRFVVEQKRLAQSPLKSLIRTPDGPSPVLLLIRHFRALYAKLERKKAISDRGDFAVIRGLLKKHTSDTLTKALDSYFRHGSTARKTLKDFRVYVSKLKNP